jgi:endothelin-converting enzyme/putative endopeptidase
VLALETAIARSHVSAADATDVAKNDNMWRRADFDAKAPGMDWAAYFKAAGLDRQADFQLWQPAAVVGASALVASQPLDAWKDYLAFHSIEHAVPVLPKAFGAEQAAFLGRLAGGPARVPDRGPQAIAATEAVLGDAIGRLYVERYFPPAAKAQAQAMAEDIRAAFRARISGLTWMSPATKEKALVKLAAVKVDVGYPESWVDYSGLALARGDAYGNLRRADAFAWRRDLAKLATPVDPHEWWLRPQMVNAFLYLSPNSLHFSAGLLQAPYFDPAGDRAANYGSAGAGMAHEISHSFDDLGNLYDDRGRMGTWWTAEDLARYRAAGAPLVAQYGAYCPQAGLCLKGDQVFQESAADLVGLEVAYDAYRLSLHGRPDVVKDGLTGDQRFFLAFAQRWRTLRTDAFLRQQVATDTHPPWEYRAETVRNMDAWYRAYDVKAGDRLYLKPEDRVRIW